MQKTKKRSEGLVWGALLILAGAFFLLQNMGFDINVGPLVGIFLFGIGGLVFLATFLTNYRERWWAAIPGATLLGLAATVFFDNYVPSVLSGLGGPLFLASIGVGFILVYLSDLQKWWALIPAGVMSTLGLVAAADELRFLGLQSDGLFFVGLGATFLMVALLTGRRGMRQSWALIPAVVLIAMGIFIGTPWLGYMENLWPLTLIGLGLWWVLRSVSQRQGQISSTEVDADPLPNLNDR